MNKFTILLVLVFFSMGSIALAQEDQWIYNDKYLYFEDGILKTWQESL